jgi:hypothetical protein
MADVLWNKLAKSVKCTCINLLSKMLGLLLHKFRRLIENTSVFYGRKKYEGFEKLVISVHFHFLSAFIIV